MSKVPKIIPRGKQILVEHDSPERTDSESDLVIPPSVEPETKAFGTVIAVGPDIKDVKVGDRVIYAAFAGERIVFQKNHKEVEYTLLDDEFVLAFLKE